MATESDNVNSGALGTLLAVGTVAMLGISLVVTALVRSEMTDEAEKKEVGADRPFRDLVAEQTAKMAAPATYVDRAMEVTVSGLIKDPNSATPPAAAGGTGGSATTEAGGTAAQLGGTGGTAAAGEAAKPAEEAKPADPAKAPEGAKRTPADEKKDAKKKDAPKPPVPAAPVPAAPAPAAPAAPAPNGQ